MKKRHLYCLLFAIPGFVAALAAAMLVFGAAAGFAWLFLFGDSPWPSGAGVVLPGIFALVFLALWAGSLVWGFKVGKRLEADPALEKKHLLLAAGVTAAAVALIALQQYGVGNLGPQSPSLVCSDYCRQLGYAASGLTPGNAGQRLCNCFDEKGQKVVSVDLEHLVGDSQP